MKSRILVVEPDTILAKLYKNTLEKEGYTVVLATDAQSAIRLLDENPVDLIVLELQLTEHSGIEFIHELRSYSEWSDLPVVLHTIVPEHAINLTRSQYRQFGIVAYAYKPSTTIGRLLQTIEQVLVPA